MCIMKLVMIAKIHSKRSVNAMHCGIKTYCNYHYHIQVAIITYIYEVVILFFC